MLPPSLSFMEITDQPLHIKWEVRRAQSRERDERIVINITGGYLEAWWPFLGFSSSQVLGWRFSVECLLSEVLAH